MGVTQVPLSSCPANESKWQPNRYTDEAGNYDFADCQGGANCSGDNVCSRLEGPWAVIYEGPPTGQLPMDRCIDAASLPAFNGNVDISVCGPGTCIGCAPCMGCFPLANVDYAATAYSVIVQTHDWLKNLQPSFTEIDFPVPAYLYGTDASAGGGTRLQLGTENLNDLGATTSIISHEYGHVLTIGLALASIREPTSLNLGEELPDVISMLMWDISCRAYNAENQNGKCDTYWDPPLDARYPSTTALFRLKLKR